MPIKILASSKICRAWCQDTRNAKYDVKTSWQHK